MKKENTEDNTRVIKDYKYKKLIKSIKEFPEMFFSIKKSGLEKGSTEELKVVKKEFQTKKALNIAAATISKRIRNMEYIEKMFRDNNIDAKFYEAEDKELYDRIFVIKYEFGDEINGLLYNRRLCFSDCITFPEDIRKIIESDIKIIKNEIRDIKINELLSE